MEGLGWAGWAGRVDGEWKMGVARTPHEGGRQRGEKDQVIGHIDILKHT